MTFFFTLFFQGKGIWDICPLGKTTAQRKSLTMGTESCPSATVSVLGKYFQHKREEPSLFQEVQGGVLQHTQEHKSQGRYTAPKTTTRGKGEKKQTFFVCAVLRTRNTTCFSSHLTSKCE